VLAERELDAADRAGEAEVVGVPAPLQLDHAVLATDRVRAAVQLVDAGHPARELPVPVDVVRVDDVADADLGRAVLRPLVDAAVDPGVAVAVDDAGRHVLAGGIDDRRAGLGGRRRSRALADRLDAAVADDDVRARDDARGAGG
ncbi:MAG: hypothetical protein ACK559_35695, partial [bacterium]